MTTDNDGTWESVEYGDLKVGDVVRTTWTYGEPQNTYERLTPPPRTFEPGDLVRATVDYAGVGELSTTLIRMTSNKWLDSKTGTTISDQYVTNIRRLVVLDEETIGELVSHLVPRVGTGESVEGSIRAFVEQEEQR